MATHDLQGRAYVRLSQLRVGDQVEVDGDFTCMEPGAIKTVRHNDGLYIECSEGQHHLDSGEGDHVVGVYPRKMESR